MSSPFSRFLCQIHSLFFSVKNISENLFVCLCGGKGIVDYQRMGKELLLRVQMAKKSSGCQQSSGEIKKLKVFRTKRRWLLCVFLFCL